MALQKQALDVPLGVGVDQKSDDVWQQPGKLISSQNTRVVKAGEIRPRKAYAYERSTSLSTIGVTSIAEVNGEMIYTTSDNNLYKSDGTWVGPVSPCTVQSFGVPHGNYRVVHTDLSYLSALDMYLVAWIIETGAAGSGVGDVVWCYVDATTFIPVSPPTRQTTATTVYGLRVCANASVGYIIYSKSDKTFTGVRVNTDGTSTGSTTITTWTNFATWDLFFVPADAAAYGIVADGLTLKAVKITVPGWVLTTATITPGGTVTAVIKVGAGGTDNRIFLAYHCTYTGPITRSEMVVYDYALALVTAAFTLTHHVGSYGFGISQSPTADVAIVASSEVVGGSATYNTDVSQVTAAGVISGYMYNMSTVISGRPITAGGKTYIPATLVDDLNSFGSGVLLDFQSTNNVRNLMAPAACWAPRQLAVYYGSFPQGVQNTALTTANRCAIVSWTYTGEPYGVVLDFADRTRHQGCQSGALYYIGGSLPMVYDGQRVTEVLPLQIPRLLDSNIVDGGAGALSAGNYAYVVTYRWTDAKGVVYESAPSPTSEGRITGLAASHQVTLSLPTLKCSLRETYGPASTFQQVEICLYRTVANGTIYYYCGKAINSPQVWSLSYTDNLSDATLVTHAILYTQGGTLANDFPPYATAVAAHKGRLWIASGSTLWYTKYIQYKEAPAFADSLTIPLASQGGITALFSIDDKLMLSTANSVYMLAGDGPTDAGQQNDYPDPIVVSQDVGATNSHGVVTGPFGAFIWSGKGLYKIDRGLAVTYEGSEVESLWAANPTVIAACRSNAQNLVYFAATDNASSAVCIVHDYVLDVWSHDIVEDATAVANAKIDAIADVGGAIYIGTRTGYIGVESSTTSRDWTTKSFEVAFITPWLKLGAIAGFQRVWRATLTGYQYAASGVSIYVANDYKPTYETARTWSSAELTGIDRLQLSAKPTTQKVEAIRVKIVPTCASVTTYPPYAFSALTLELGVKGAAKRLGAGSRK